MKKLRLVLNESLVTNINSNQVDVIEDVSVQQKPDYQIIDITVIPDEEYNPTIQSILIDLDESSRLCESVEESKNLSINILSETVNIKTGYSNSLFEFENKNHTITLSLVLQETERRGIYKVEAYTTKGEKVFESNTCKPKKLIESYLNSLANEYLIDKPLKEGYSLGDDKESFEIWDKENEKLKKIYDYVTAGSRKDLEEVMKTVEHSQDSIYHADVTIKGLKEEDINKENQIFDLMQKYPFVDNIQITKWYGDEVVCFIGFDIDGAYSDRRLDAAIRTCLEALFGKDYLNYPNSLNEAEETVKTLKDDEGGTTVKVIKAPNGRYFNYYYSTDEEHWDSSAGPFNTAEEAITMAKKHRPNAKESINWREEEKKLLGDVKSVKDEALKEFYKIFVEQGKTKFAERVKKEMDRRGLKEAEDPMVDTVKEDLDIEPGSDEESQVDSFNLRDLDEWIESLYEEGLNVDEIFNHLTVMNSVPEDYGITEDELRNKIDSVVGDAQEGFSVEDFVKATKLVDEIKNLNIDYSKWNDASQEERIKLVTPELNRFYNKYKVDFEKNPDLFSLVLYNLDDDNFHTEANVLRKLNGEEI